MNPIAFLYAAALKATVIFAAAGLLSLALRRTSSSVRYFIWTCALVTVLAVPAISYVVRWNVPLSSVRAAAPMMVVAPIEQKTAADIALPASSPTRRALPWVLTIWLCGAGLVLARLAVGHLRILQALRRTESLDDPKWVRLLEEASSRVGSRRPVELKRGHEIDVPLSYGFLRPVVLLPGASEEWSMERRRVVLMHELVHARRLDSLFRLIAQVSCALYWFHPLAWVALSRFRQEQERSCDDAVVRAGTGQSAYAEHLVSLARSLSASQGNWSAALGMAETCDLERRVHALLDPLRNRRGLSRRLCAAALAGVVACVIPLAAVRAQDSQSTASLAGSVLDASGAAVPKAVITLKNADKSHQEITRAGMDGTYRFANILAGTYSLQAKAPGFAVFDQPDVALKPGSSEQLNVKLDLGQITENVDVVGKGPVRPATGVPQRIRVGGNVQATKLVRSVKPVYPVEAESVGIEGTVLLRAVISMQGGLMGLAVINTAVDPTLAKAAMDAVQQWHYQPTLLNGVPVEVITTIAVNFRLER